MQRYVTRGATKLSLLSLLGLVVAATISLLFAHTTFADNRGPWNGAEAEAMSLCGSLRRGAIWFTNSGNYYGDTVVIEGNDTRNEIPVGIRGSVYSCATGGTAHTGATDVRPEGVNAWRLYGLTSSTLDRGVVSGARNWSSQGNQIDATLNISGLATNNNGRDDSATIQIGIFRCFRNFTTNSGGECYTQIINVTVIRKAKPIVWSLSGSSTVRKGTGASSANITATPGDRLTWTHQLRNNGPNATNTNVWSNLGMSGFTNGWSSGLSQVVMGPGAGVGVIRSSFSNNVYDVTQNDVGRTLCQWVQFDPTNTSGGRNGRGSQACAAIPYNYTLTPTVALNRTEVEVGGQVGVTGTVNNSGPTKSQNTTWQFSYITIAPGSTNVPTAGVTTAAPCTFYAGAGRTCQTVPALSFASGGAANGAQVFNPGSVAFSRVANVGDLPVGTQVCYALSVRAASSSATTSWSHSAARCAYVAKRPLAQVIGGDLIVGRGGATSSIVSTNTKLASGQKFGAWSEYGIASSGLINGMASASGYAGGTTVTNLCGVSFLSFSNKVGTAACADNRIGQYVFRAAASTIAGRFPVTSAETISGSRGVDGLTSGRTYTGSGTITLTAPANYRVEPGKWVVINAPNATVNINNNIRYTDGALTSISQIPQVIIIAQNIVIADTVTQVDAWLVATGTGANGRVNTCRVTNPNSAEVIGFTDLTSDRCREKLQVNGPVIANHLFLRRTAGAGTGEASGDPAEVFNLRPDAYLWASNLQTGTAKAQTVLTTELPPRY